MREHSPEKVLDLLTKCAIALANCPTGSIGVTCRSDFIISACVRSGIDCSNYDIVREQVVDLFFEIVLECLGRCDVSERLALNQYRRDEHERTLSDFRSLDRQIPRRGARITAILDLRNPGRATTLKTTAR